MKVSNQDLAQKLTAALKSDQLVVVREALQDIRQQTLEDLSACLDAEDMLRLQGHARCLANLLKFLNP